jgi:hypothetical protein
MAILNFPSISPEIHDFGIRYNTQISTSSLSGITQTVELPGARWFGSLRFSDMTPEESAELKAFLLKLRGSSGRFYFGDLTHTSPFNTVTGSPTIESVSTPRTIRTTLGSGSPAFLEGDYIQIGTDNQRELKMIVESTNVAGDVYDLTVEPMIRRTDFIGLSIDYTSPVGIFFLTSDDQASWASRGKGILTDINIEFVENFYV